MPNKRVVALAMGLCVWGAGGHAWAINQCVGPDGKVSFQDAPCAPEQMAKEIILTPGSHGITPTEGSKPRPPEPAPAATTGGQAAPAGAAPAARPADCPSAAEMQQLQVQAESIALPLPIRNQKRRDFEALKARCP